jgi:hypothetical protein
MRKIEALSNDILWQEKIKKDIQTVSSAKEPYADRKRHFTGTGTSPTSLHLKIFLETIHNMYIYLLLIYDLQVYFPYPYQPGACQRHSRPRGQGGASARFLTAHCHHH